MRDQVRYRLSVGLGSAGIVLGIAGAVVAAVGDFGWGVWAVVTIAALLCVVSSIVLTLRGPRPRRHRTSIAFPAPKVR